MAKLVRIEEPKILFERKACIMVYDLYNEFFNLLPPSIVAKSERGVKYYRSISKPIQDAPSIWYQEILGKEFYPEKTVSKAEWINLVVYPIIWYLGYDTNILIEVATELGIFDNLGYEFINDWYLPNEPITEENAEQIIQNVKELVKSE